jgi:hypothetical protein
MALKKNQTYLNPAGFIEQKYIGYQTEKNTTDGIAKLQGIAKKLEAQHKPVLILIDITQLGGTSSSARMAGISGMRRVKYKRAAMYGPLSTQILVNTLAMIAGKQNKTKAFSDRAEALKWLRGGSKEA